MFFTVHYGGNAAFCYLVAYEHENFKSKNVWHYITIFLDLARSDTYYSVVEYLWIRPFEVSKQWRKIADSYVNLIGVSWRVYFKSDSKCIKTKTGSGIICPSLQIISRYFLFQLFTRVYYFRVTRICKQN